MPSSVFGNAGQDCCARSRILVERSAYDDFVAALTDATEAMTVGDPLDETTEMGPMISDGQRRTSLDYLGIGAEEGARVVTGGEVPDRPGFYLSPAVVADVDNSMRIAREEIFGPVLTIIPHDGDDDAVRIANDSPYGLSGAVHSGDLERGWAVARRVRTGTMGINGGIWYGGDVPFGGYKASGIGREMGVAGFEEYLETKSVAEPA